jgi:hypothetical protein
MSEESRRFVLTGLLVMGVIVLGFASTIRIRHGMVSENEDHAVRSLLEIRDAQARAGGRNLRELGEARLIPADLAEGIRQGYVFALSAGKGGWIATATPVSPSSGERNFIIGPDGVVRFSTGDPATLSSPAVE